MNEKDTQQNLTDETLARKTKYENLVSMGFEPFGRKFNRSGLIADLQAEFEVEKKVCVAGRIVALRKQGKAMFLDIKDSSGKMQVFLHKQQLGDDGFEVAKNLHVGDFLGVDGEFFLTRTQMQTILGHKITPLSKAIRPLPEKWHGLKDVETIYRQRYLDLISNDESMKRFSMRAQIISEIRRYMEEKNCMEVETPMLQALCGGATANPFKTFYEALGDNFYLRIAPELSLKKLLVGGFERIFELNRSFRNEGISKRHNPEFTMLEVYWAYEDYHTMMDITEEIFVRCARKVVGNTVIKYAGNEIDLTPPWERLKFHDAIEKYTDFDTAGMSPAQIAEKAGVELEGNMTDDEILVAIFEEVAEPNLIGPVFIIDYPSSVSPLSKTSKENPDIAERFELYINGFELANAYSELNDPFVQREKFEEQVRLHPSEDAQVDEGYLTAMEHGMPPAGGLGIGIDRMAMILTGAETIRDVILFPQLKNRD